MCCLNFIITVKFPNSFLFVISNFIPLWWEGMCSIMALLLNILIFVLWASIWFILENVPCTLEKNVFCYWLEYSIDVRWSNCFIMLFKSTISVLIFSLVVLSVTESEALKSPTIIVELSSFPFNFFIVASFILELCSWIQLIVITSKYYAS